MTVPSAGKKWQMFGWILIGSDGRREEKERKADCFSLLSCYLIELETAHCSNALTGVFFFSSFQLDVSVTENYTSSTASERGGK